ncbi:hypothetical protein E5N71_00815 [Candidatus Nitrosocosmicus sp. SS]|jgi:hypothetical protein|nr:hypothetical protein F1Z66_00090 [Candidatus Nitrosocosmicus sp. SS]KAF0870104.1 hypothetical protein E5N71_00815 [Candidatus Nitrosocosmicus sp. SS]
MINFDRNMNKNLLTYITMFFGFGLFIICYDQTVVGQNLDVNNNTEPISFLKPEINSLDISEPIYQTINGSFISTRELSTSPTLVTEEMFGEDAIMKDIGNVKNNMTFINTYNAQSTIIQGKGNGTIETSDGQTIDWMSSDIGVINERGLIFHGIILFDNTNSEKLSFLNGKLGIYEDSPEVHRTIWLLN